MLVFGYELRALRLFLSGLGLCLTLRGVYENELFHASWRGRERPKFHDQVGQFFIAGASQQWVFLYA